MYCTKCGYENTQNYRYCASCEAINPFIKLEEFTEPPSTQDSLNEFITIAIDCSCTFKGIDAEDLDADVKKAMGVSKKSSVIYNIYASPNFFIVIPVSKDHSAMAWYGLLLGGGALAGAAVGALSGWADKIERKNARQVIGAENPLSKAIVFDSRNIRVQAHEVNSANAATGLYLWAKVTYFYVYGTASYMGNSYSCSLKFGIKGQVINPKNRVYIYDSLKSALGLSEIPIFSGKNPDF
jgi:hypothetical protein